MEVEKAGTESNRTWKVWLDEDEQEQIVNYAQQNHGTRNRLIVELGLHSGLRSFEIPQIRPDDIHIEQVGDEYLPMITVREGKDTRGEGGKRRDTVLPNRDLFDVYSDSHGIQDGEPFVDLSARRVQQIVKEIVEGLADETGNEDWAKVSSHDLRRSWGHKLLVRRNMNARAVMGAGGWNDYDTMTDYLTKADSGTIAESYIDAMADE